MPGRAVKRDAALNLACSFVKVVGVLLVIRYAGQLLTPAAFGLFLLARRIAEMLANLLQAGASQTLRRYQSIHQLSSLRMLYLLAALTMVAVTTSVFCLAVVFGGGRPLAELAFGRAFATRALGLWLGMLSIAMVFHFMANSLLLSHRRVVMANILDFLNASLWLLACMWLLGPRASVLHLIRFQASATLATSLAVLSWFVVSLWLSRRERVDWSQAPAALRESVAYGLPRGVIPSAELLFYSLGPWLLRNNAAEAGYLIVAFTVLRLCRTVIQPAALVFGIAVARLVGRGDEASLRRGIALLLGVLLCMGALLTAVTLPWTRLLLGLWLGNPEMASRINVYATLIVLAMTPAAVFQGLKEPIEMIWKRPRNLLTILVVLAVLAVWIPATRGVFTPARSVIYGYLVAFWIAAGISVLWVRGYLQPVGYFGLGRLLPLAGLVWALNALAAHVSGTWPQGAQAAMAAVSCSVGILAAFGVLCYHRPSRFVRDALSFALPKSVAQRLGLGRDAPVL